MAPHTVVARFIEHQHTAPDESGNYIPGQERGGLSSAFLSGTHTGKLSPDATFFVILKERSDNTDSSLCSDVLC